VRTLIHPAHSGLALARLRGGIRIFALALAVGAGIAAFVALGGVKFGTTDFAAGLYPAARAVWQGVDPYDGPAFQSVLRAICPQIPFNYLGYPPWAVLATLWLGLLPVDAAGRLWMLVNLGLALTLANVLVPGGTRRTRTIAMIAAIAYVPALDVLFVGQYTLPTALGAALLVRSTRTGSAAAGGVGLALLAFKPHVGVLVALAAAPSLLRSNRRALAIGVGSGLALAAASFVVSTSWVRGYVSSSAALLVESGNVICDTCASVVGILTRRYPGVPAIPAMLAAVAAVAALSWRRPPEVKIAAGVIASALALPLFRSYDSVVLLVPMFVAARRATPIGLAVLGVAWTLPVVTLFTPRAGGVHALWASAVLVLIVLIASPDPDTTRALGPNRTGAAAIAADGPAT
jgi:hypothetical protein